MELFYELFLTVAISVVVSFVIAKIVSLASGGGVKGDALLGSCKDGESGRDAGEGLGSVGCEAESVVGKLEVEEVLDDGVAIAGLGERLVEGSCDEKTVEVGGVVSGLVEECVEREGSTVERESVEDDVGVELEKTERDCDESPVEGCDGVGGVHVDTVEEYVGGQGSSEKPEAVEEKPVIELEEGLMKGDSAEKTAEVPDRVGEVEAGLSEKIEAVVESGGTLMKGDCGEQAVEVCGGGGGSSEKSEAVGSLKCEIKNEAGDEREDLFDDDWEGIPRTELDRVFGAAAAFVGSEKNANEIMNLNSDVRMQLYGLHKIAIEGPCREPPPMALKIAARAKWNAWQQLGDMSPEAAMEQYVALLSRDIPGWSADDPHDTQTVRLISMAVPPYTCMDHIYLPLLY